MTITKFLKTHIGKQALVEWKDASTDINQPPNTFTPAIQVSEGTIANVGQGWLHLRHNLCKFDNTIDRHNVPVHYILSGVINPFDAVAFKFVVKNKKVEIES